MIAYTENPETSSYSWEYRGGCYANGDIGVYEKAVSGTDYLFDFVPIEIREDESLYKFLLKSDIGINVGRLVPIQTILINKINRSKVYLLNK